MARKHRIHVAGALYHVILRGNNGQEIFRDSRDRYQLQDLVEEGARRFGYQLLGYCWMGNHIHAAVQVGRISLSAAMHNLSFRYTGYFNWRHKRIGHVFQGRYKAILIDSDSYLLQLVRYIHMNPVRARLVGDPGAWEWSSHRVYLGDAGQPPWLATAPVLERFHAQEPRARAAYRKFMGMPEELMSPLDFKRGNQKTAVLGSDLFAHRMECKAGWEPSRGDYSTVRIVEAVCLAGGVSEEALRTSRRGDVVQARTAAAHLVATEGDGNLTALAQLLGRDPSTMSRAAGRYEASEGARQVAAGAQAILRNASMHA